MLSCLVKHDSATVFGSGGAGFNSSLGTKKKRLPKWNVRNCPVCSVVIGEYSKICKTKNA